MTEITLDSYGKVNLALDIVSKREDGYHNINTIMQSISLKDKVKIRRLEEDKIIIECNDGSVPIDSRNIVYKVWDKLKKEKNLEGGIYIDIDKNIPVGAGLAGGSTNAASTIKGINKLWKLDMSMEEMQSLGKSIGADVPFCLIGGTKIARGIGEEFEEIKSYKGKNILLCNPGFEISTKEVYNNLKIDEERVNIQGLAKSLEENNKECIRKNSINKMEDYVISKYPELKNIKKIMNENGAIFSLMSGSGPTIFGIFDGEEEIKKAKEELKKDYKKVYICKTI